ncbi:trypsin-like peptidase domain-containing protein [Thalassovita taeanensis]|uniref:Sporulation related domain-containing protein n=1 Tax=Thalassovita taeanensis TaxID=657014 RepID=A0A1H9ETX4_9RHOB|nr:trypsin-like peptidase domain-containing protein [Thalassovita taeanensis]SEQ29072.1 Sporulation related domain-containing protein [Thalassovita taeanensis]
MMRFLVSVFFVVVLSTRSLMAQEDPVWVQVEAQPSLTAAQERIRDYATQLQDVNGFALGGGWYAVALGPYQRGDAEQVLRVLRAEGKIPRDSYIAFSSNFRRQFWPIGVDTLASPALARPSAPDNSPAITDTASPAPVIVAESDETPREARQSEALLSREERMELQSMLKWAGFYNSAIDGAFGRGTRSSMAAWQQANGYDATGILTTRQRAALYKQYTAVLDGLDLRLVQDHDAGIEMKLPTGVVAFDKYEAPFAHYAATGDIPAKVLLISQTGNQATLFGLYDIMQTLAIVPAAGPRERGRNDFMLIGQGADFVSHTQATLQDGQIKGFTLVWPAGDEERRTRLLSEMQASFARTGGVLSAAAGNNEDQSIDLVAGLEIRKPRLTRSGFYSDANGTVVTTTQAVTGCSRITLDTDIEAQVLSTDEALGIAILRPTATLAPISVATLQLSAPRLQSDVAVAGYSYGGVLGAPTLTFGTLADLRGLGGEEQLKRLTLNALPGDAGGPVFDAGGNVLGMLLPRPDGTQKLPDDVSFALDSGSIGQVLTRLGLSANATDQLGQMDPEDVSTMAGGMTVLVGCWD